MFGAGMVEAVGGREEVAKSEQWAVKAGKLAVGESEEWVEMCTEPVPWDSGALAPDGSRKV